ncbi:hypothetical protein SmJEL517_g04100 [Synchytrium microbalum]|uniref:Uncharacterized protein n=1 Tax=Synchytrium microbalum TaxID=1806994 RepID=A0A507C0I6_9FUNG|nr:uncharacterized protein SmJEL517_g04100 [Synchytrium microbalum]TPX32921.1 hypothetical protein SmJEL517_g04100 [Synchytrium microbalum]
MSQANLGRLVSVRGGESIIVNQQETFLTGSGSLCNKTDADAQCCLYVVQDQQVQTVLVECLGSKAIHVNNSRVSRGQKTMLQHKDELNLSSDHIFIFHSSETSTSGTEEDSVNAKYDIKAALGRGNFSTVKLAVNKATGERCAVKIVDKKRIRFNSKALNAVGREIDILKSLDHINIIKLRDSFDEQNVLYIVLDLATGGDLFGYVLERERLTGREARDYFVQMLSAIQYCHSKNVTHRDLKPENFLIQNPVENVLKLADFGSASGSTSKELNTVAGTPLYMAPEIHDSQTYTHLVDNYSLGGCLFFMLSGESPYSGLENKQLHDAIKMGRISFSHPEWKGKNSNAITLIQGLMEVDPQRRMSLDAASSHSWLSSFEQRAAVSVTPDHNTIAQLISKASCTNISKPRFTIGRQAECDLVLSNILVSGQHVVIEFKDDGVITLTDTSTNGVRINGVRVEKGSTVEIKHGDTISLDPNHTTTLSDLVWVFKEIRRQNTPRKRKFEELESSQSAKSIKTSSASFNLISLSKRFPSLQNCHKTSMLFGRHADCDVLIADSRVSSRHCLLSLTDGNRVAELEDLSSNGTFVNGVVVGRGNKVSVENGMVIALVKEGDKVTIGYRLAFA